ncbi:cob(I)yrinic acid a,c-diamide adenosyltransferase [Halobacterium salinarum]|uniref:cob(I)yrinic acid a,c-diamide adenosyltransferase n=1 Tax=Halobacterium salinarum TaxID=2242 RepID=UPI00255387E2|nr:cob(I)yrinic acid a,c-diamide adenosyltransferase [Halobacterium salinarum]MDL0124971.1 cob(I)yrinic acid a,c-diamide adenosyltransferase [Halobacterium salinarum]
MRPAEITPTAPAEFGLVQVWWGDGKGKTTAALGMAMRAAGHGFRTHVVQLMKGGTGTVEDVRGEYAAIDAVPGITYENAGHYGWHGFHDGSSDDEHAARANGGLARAQEIVDASTGVDGAVPLDADPTEGVHLLVLDEVLYAANRGLVDPEDVVALIDAKPDDLEVVLTGGHTEPTFVTERADLVTEVRKQRHPMENGQGARKGTEY